MTFTENCNTIFNRAIDDYHVADNVDTPIANPYGEGTMDAALYRKCWIDTVQWHLEDIIRDPDIDPAAALQLKRRIDRSNQERTDLVAARPRHGHLPAARRHSRRQEVHEGVPADENVQRPRH